MGIDTEVRDSMREYWAKKSFTGVKEGLAKLSSDYVSVYDMLAYVLHELSPNYTRRCTSIQFYQMVTDRVKRAFANEGARVFVCSVDDEHNKSWLKRTTHVKRDAASAAVPYPETSAIVNDGIYDSATKKTEALDLDRFAVSRWLRPSMWLFVDRLIQMDNFYDRDHLFIFEFDKKGPKLYPGLDAWPRNVPMYTSLCHNHHEADPSLIFWVCRVFSTMKARIITTDTDVIPLLHQALSGTARDACNPAIIWTPNAEYAVDVLQLTKDCRDALGMTGEALAMACILCGTDYVDKMKYAKGFGHLVIFAACRRRKDLIDALCTLANKYTYAHSLIISDEHIDEALVSFDVIMRVVYEHGRKTAWKDRMKLLKPIETITTTSTTTAITTTTIVTASSSTQTPSSRKRKHPQSTASTSTATTVTITTMHPPPSWTTLQEEYQSFKKWTLPNTDALRECVKRILLNFMLWRQQATFALVTK